MKEKTTLVLMEQLVMVLVFAIAAAVCLRLFMVSEQISRKNEAVSHAALLAQNAAELLKDGQGNENACGEIQETTLNGWTYRLLVAPEETGVSGLGRAQIQVTGQDGDKNEELLIQIQAAWQEDIQNER